MKRFFRRNKWAKWVIGGLIALIGFKVYKKVSEK